MDPPATPERPPFDEITAELRRMRVAAHEPSSAELVRRVIEIRVARGLSHWEARVGRTTVYDAFRPGRRMIDPTLVGDLARALGGSAQDAATLVERCERTWAPARAVASAR